MYIVVLLTGINYYIKAVSGRHKSRWEDDVRNDLKKMKLVKWAVQVQDRSKWKAIVFQICSAIAEN